MPPRKPSAKAAADDAELNAMLNAAIRANEAVPGSLAALRLEQQQREAREREEEARKKAAEDATHLCGSASPRRTAGAPGARWWCTATRRVSCCTGRSTGCSAGS